MMTTIKMNSMIVRHFGQSLACGVMLCSLALTSNGLASGQHGDAKTKQTMRGMAQDFKTLLPLVLNRPAFYHSGNEVVIGKHLSSLAHKTTHIAGPDKKLADVGFVASATEFSQTVHKADRFFKNGQKRQARFLLESSLEYCVSCHSQRHGHSSSSFAESIGIAEPDAKLGRLGKPKYYTMTRQFDRAVAAYEDLLSGASPELERMTLAPYTEYLTLRLRVAENLPAAEAFLAKVEKTSPKGLVRKDISDWRKSLADIRGWKDRSSLAAAERMIKKASTQKVYPMDASSLVYYIYASKVLRQLIDQHPESSAATVNSGKTNSGKTNIAKVNTGKTNIAKVNTGKANTGKTGKAKGTTQTAPKDKAKLFHLLGLCENNINRFNLSAVHYFQKAIELAPHTPIARKAYSEYEDIVVFSFTGSSGTHIPNDQKGRMDRLKKLAF